MTTLRNKKYLKQPNLYIKEIKKEEQMQTKVGRRREITKSRAKINTDKKKKKAIQKINERAVKKKKRENRFTKKARGLK